MESTKVVKRLQLRRTLLISNMIPSVFLGCDTWRVFSTPWSRCHWAPGSPSAAPWSSPGATADLWSPASSAWSRSRPASSAPGHPARRWTGAADSQWGRGEWVRSEGVNDSQFAATVCVSHPPPPWHTRCPSFCWASRSTPSSALVHTEHRVIQAGAGEKQTSSSVL